MANGVCERVNRTIVPMIIKSINTENRWDERLKEIERDFNTAVNKTTNKSPFETLYGFVPHFYDGAIHRMAEIDEEGVPPEIIQREVRANIVQSQKLMKKQYDNKRYTGVNYAVGDIIVVRGGHITPGESSKTKLRYKGPFIVVEVLTANTYRIAKLNDSRRGNQHLTTAHVSQMKIYSNAGEESDNSDDDGDDDDEDETDTNYAEVETINQKNQRNTRTTKTKS